MALSREPIVTAALELVERDGWEALSMRRLAVELDVWPMAIYRHFSDKEDLLAAVAEAAADKVASPGSDLRTLAYAARGLRPSASLVQAARRAGAPDEVSARAFVGATCGFEGDDDAFAALVELLVAALGEPR
jgi:AcrR family transcriptional regulator